MSYLLFRLIAHENDEDQKEIVEQTKGQCGGGFGHQICMRRVVLVHGEAREYRVEKHQSVAHHHLKHEAQIDEIAHINADAVNLIQLANRIRLIFAAVHCLNFHHRALIITVNKQ